MSGTFNPPANPTVGQLYTFAGTTWRYDGTAWVNANTGQNFVPIGGGTMTGPLILSGDAPATAPLQAVTYEQVANAINAAPHNVGRNLLHNALFNVQQRGAGSWTTSGYTADRWVQYINGSTASTNLNPLNDANRTQIGDEAARYSLTSTFTGTAGAGDAVFYYQPIESIRRLSGKTVTVSFWTATSAGNLKIGASVDLITGTGGSPSANVLGNGQTITATPAYTRYSLTFTVPSSAGLTLGTNGNDSVNLNLWLTAGANFNTRSGNVGVQSGTINLWGLQLEIGTVATPLEKLDPQQDLANCQRFYFTSGSSVIINAYNTAGTGIYGAWTLPVTMRAVPTISYFSINNTNATGPGTYGSITAAAVAHYLTVTATGSASSQFGFTASADL